jgi:hypothetical protein
MMPPVYQRQAPHASQRNSFDPERLGFDESDLEDLPGYDALFHVFAAKDRKNGGAEERRPIRYQPFQISKERRIFGHIINAAGGLFL